MANEPEPGEYVHYKGGRYTVLLVATNSTDGTMQLDHGDENVINGRRVVVYVSHQGYGVRVRDLEQWNETVEWPEGMGNGPRFRRCFPADVDACADFIQQAGRAERS